MLCICWDDKGSLVHFCVQLRIQKEKENGQGRRCMCVIYIEREREKKKKREETLYRYLAQFRQCLQVRSCQ